MGSKPIHPAAAIAKFLASEVRRNEWLAARHVSLYVRKSVRAHTRGAMSFARQCLDVAAWEISSYRWVRKHRPYSYAHLRQLIDFMQEIERAVVLQGWAGVFVELVRDEVLQKHLQANGYSRCAMNADPRPSFFKSRATIVATSPWVGDLRRRRMHVLSKPSLRAFAADPSLSAYWVRDQASGHQILLKRELINAHTLTPQLRVTVAEFTQGVAKKFDRDGDESPPPRDPLRVRHALMRVLERVQRMVRGVSQLAIRLEAIDEAEDKSSTLQWLLDQGYEMEQHDRMRESITDRLVKHLP